MERKKNLMKVLVIGAICLLTLPSIQGALVETSSSEPSNSDEENISNAEGTEYYENCVVWIFGNCNLVGGALTWIFGVYCPLSKKHIWISAGGESLNAIITGSGSGLYLSIENLFIDMWGTTGFLFWAGKSLLISGNFIFARCKVDRCYITS